jgi:NADH-quinone oxidoreductase subunit G
LPQTFAALENMAVGNDGMVAALAGILAALAPNDLDKHLASLVAKAVVETRHQAIAASLKKAERAGVYLGALTQAHPDLSLIRQIAQAIAHHSGATLGEFAAAGNSAGAWLAGALPHRLPGGAASAEQGLNAAEMLSKTAVATMLIGIEPELDSLHGRGALAVLQQSAFNVVINPFMTDAMRSYAHVMLPMVTFAETSGTYVNTEGLWQGMRAVARPLGEARPAWKILRVLGNLLNLEGFEFMSSEDVRDELRSACQNVQLSSNIASVDVAVPKPVDDHGMQRLGGVAMFAVDALVRRSASLQETADAQAAKNVRLHPEEIQRLGLAIGGMVEVSSGMNKVHMAVQADENLPVGCAWVVYGTDVSMALGDALHVQIKGV